MSVVILAAQVVQNGLGALGLLVALVLILHFPHSPSRAWTLSLRDRFKRRGTPHLTHNTVDVPRHRVADLPTVATPLPIRRALAERRRLQERESSLGQQRTVA